MTIVLAKRATGTHDCIVWKIHFKYWTSQYTVSALNEAYQMLSETSRLSFQICSQSPATKRKVLYNQKSSEQYQLSSELANKNHQRRFQIEQTLTKECYVYTKWFAAFAYTFIQGTISFTLVEICCSKLLTFYWLFI